MDQELHVRAGFLRSASLTEIVRRIQPEPLVRDLSHMDDDCPVCAAQAELDREVRA